MGILEDFSELNFEAYAPDNLYGLQVSVAYIVLTAGLIRLLRIVLGQLAPTRKAQGLVLEFLATLELITIAFELGIVLVNHGFAYYGFFLVLLLNYWGKTWPPAGVTPHPHILAVFTDNWSQKKISVQKLIAQILAGLVAFTLYVRPIWGFGYRPEHLKKLEDTRCFAHLQVPPYYGIAIEAGATFIFLMAGRILGPKRFSSLTVPLIFVGLKKLGLKFTGCYMNPILAAAIQYGCEEASIQDHLSVYWGGPLLGLAVFKALISVLTGFVAPPKPKPKGKPEKAKGKSKRKKE